MRALISVSDKSGVLEFARALADLGATLLSTGGTARVLREGGLDVQDVSEVTGFPEILGGRVKTLHPGIHGGILARDTPEHLGELDGLGIEEIDLVCVNLYPFEKTVAAGATLGEALEEIDIGGPTMIRGAAKNHEKVVVVVDPKDYDDVITALQEAGKKKVDSEFRRRLAAKAFRHTSAYDGLIAQVLGAAAREEIFPEYLPLSFERVDMLRYGENPHQEAAFYRSTYNEKGGLSEARQLHGKALSYNNLNDSNAALDLLAEFDETAVIAVKHMNPCGVGLGENLSEAFQRALEGDPISIFGGIIALNRPVDLQTAQQMNEIFLEVIMAPSFSPEALELLQKKKNLRLLEIHLERSESSRALKLTSIRGGLLAQTPDRGSLENASWNVVTEKEPTEEQERALRFGWKVVKHVKSNAIVINGAEQTYGIGAGQMNRVGAARIAMESAGEKVQGAVMASDAFFPMKDTVELAAEMGISAIIQPGGSIRDQESIDAANEAGIAMVFTGMRHFTH